MGKPRVIASLLALTFAVAMSLFAFVVLVPFCHPVSSASLSTGAGGWGHDTFTEPRRDISDDVQVELQAVLRPRFPFQLVNPKVIQQVPGRLVAGPIASGTRVAWLVEIAGSTEIYSYDLNLGTGRYLSVGRGRKEDLSISGNLLAWTDYREGYPSVYIYNLYSNLERQVASPTGLDGFLPRLWGNYLAWYKARGERKTGEGKRDEDKTREGGKIVAADLLWMDLGSARGARIVASDCDPAVAPVIFGPDVFYRSVSTDSPGLTRVNIESGKRFWFGFDGFPAWCDGERLLAFGSPESGYRQLYEIKFKEFDTAMPGLPRPRPAGLEEPFFRRITAFPSGFRVTPSDCLAGGYGGLVAISGSATGPDGKRLPGIGYLYWLRNGSRSLLEVRTVPRPERAGGEVGPLGENAVSDYAHEVSEIAISGVHVVWGSIPPSTGVYPLSPPSLTDVSPSSAQARTLIWAARLFVTYSDIQDHWARKTIERFPQAILGYDDGTFHPDGPVSRTELVSLFGWKSSHLEEGHPLIVRRWELARALAIALASRGLLPEREAHPEPFLDEDEIPQSTRQLIHSLSRDWLKGYPDGTFRPEKPVTRAEALTLFERWNDYLAGLARPS